MDWFNKLFLEEAKHALDKHACSGGSSGGSGFPSDADQIAMLIEVDMLPAVYNTNGKILTDETGRIVLRY